MCVILEGTKKQFSRDEVIDAFLTNPDGVGVLVEGGKAPQKVRTLRSFLKIYDTIEEKSKVVFHFRISTGGVGLHPFKIPETEFYLFHNGIVGSSINGKPDTRLLAEKLRGLTLTDILSSLTFLNKKGKGKFTVATADLKVCKCIGFKTRSNENHILPFVSPYAHLRSYPTTNKKTKPLKYEPENFDEVEGWNNMY